MSQQPVAQVFSHDSLQYTLLHLAGSWTVTETTDMGEYNGTNLKPIPQTVFLTSL